MGKTETESKGRKGEQRERVGKIAQQRIKRKRNTTLLILAAGSKRVKTSEGRRLPVGHSVPYYHAFIALE